MRSSRIPLLLLLSSLALVACSEAGQTEIARGNVLASQRKFDEAIEAYRAAAKASPNKARPRELLGHVLFDQKRIAEARAAYEDARAVEPEAALEAEIGLARLEAEEGKLDAAIEHLARVIERQPGNVYARLSRANLAMRRGAEKDAELAIEDTAAAMKVDSDNPSVLYTRGCAFIAARDLPKATETFELLAKAHPASPLPYYGRARVAGAGQARADVILNLREAKSRSKAAPGSWDVAQIRDDPAFRFMQDDPDFQKELAER
jgi:tetratricopeptide (TPR) repeat protein